MEGDAPRRARGYPEQSRGHPGVPNRGARRAHGARGRQADGREPGRGRACRRHLPLLRFGRLAPRRHHATLNQARHPDILCARAAGCGSPDHTVELPLAIPTWKMAPALICGNTVVIKPATDASLDAAELVRVLAEAGLPGGVVNMVTGSGGTVGDALVTDPRVKGVSFTGSTPVGLGIQARAVGKKVQLEMGGKNPYLVMEDADLSDAAQKISYGAFGYAGQKCTASSRAIVTEDVYDEFLDELTNATEAMKVGDPRRRGPGRACGEQEPVREHPRSHRDGARGGARGPRRRRDGLRGRGLLHLARHRRRRGQSKSKTAQEEIFGPVLAVIKARDFDHAVELANDTRYGLTAGIATRSLRYAYEFIARSEAGLANVNVPTAGLEFQVPFGGNKESGVGGREQGPAALDFYSSWKTVAIRPV